MNSMFISYIICTTLYCTELNNVVEMFLELMTYYSIQFYYFIILICLYLGQGTKSVTLHIQNFIARKINSFTQIRLVTYCTFRVAKSFFFTMKYLLLPSAELFSRYYFFNYEHDSVYCDISCQIKSHIPNISL